MASSRSTPRLGRTNSTIRNWATLVQPGSPAPQSPQRRPSVSSRRSSVPHIGRRPSIGHSRATEGSFLHLVQTPSTASAAEFVDLTVHGYNYVFVPCSKTPTTPSPYFRQKNAAADIPIPPIPQESQPTKRIGMKRIRSLSILLPKRKKQPADHSQPALPSATEDPKVDSRGRSASAASQPEICAATIAKRKHAKYAYVPPPPTLANELELMQFVGGGSLESAAKRVMKAEAKAAAGSRKASASSGAGVSTVYRDEQGAMWWDEDEKLEYAHLLDGIDALKAEENADELEWEEFDNAHAPLEARSESLVRRMSAQTTSTVDSDLDPKFLVSLPEDDALPNDRVFASSRAPGKGMLSLPSRPRRRAPHLCKPSSFLVDTSAFASTLPKSPRASTAKTRRRPAPLTLTNSAHANANAKVHFSVAPAPTVKTLSPGAVEKAKQEFLDDSFDPVPVAEPPMPPSRSGQMPSFVALDSYFPVMGRTTDNAKIRTTKRGVRFGGLFSRKGN